MGAHVLSNLFYGYFEIDKNVRFAVYYIAFHSEIIADSLKQEHEC